MAYSKLSRVPGMLGDDAVAPLPTAVDAKQTFVDAFTNPAALVVNGAMVYHGYKRTGSVIWALLWGMTGIVGIPFALAQGFAEPKKKRK